MTCIRIPSHIYNKPVVYWKYLGIDLTVKCNGLKNYGFNSPVGGAGIEAASQW